MKYLLLKHYRGGPAPEGDWVPMEQWQPEEIDDHVQYMNDFAARLEETGEFVDSHALGGLTTRQIAAAYLVPEETMAQRITRAKRRIAGLPFEYPGDGGTVPRVLYLIFNEGYTGEVDLADEAIRLTRRLARGKQDPEVGGLLALMLLHDARRHARIGRSGRLIPLREQDRSLWNTKQIAEAVSILQTALSRDRLGEYQAQAAIAALHADAPRTGETDWRQIVEWYDELLALTASPVAQLNRAVALAEAHGAQAGLSALAGVDASLPRYTAVLAHLSELAGDLPRAARLYAQVSGAADNVPERDHLIREAARVRGRHAALQDDCELTRKNSEGSFT